MGIDFLDVLFRIERAFGVRIARAELLPALREGTVGALFVVVLRKLDALRLTHGNLSDRLLGKIRLAFADLFGVPEERVTPDAELDALLPREDRRGAWRRLGESLGLPLPALRRPAWLRALMRYSTSAFLLAGSVGYLATRQVGNLASLWLLFGVGLGTAAKFGVFYSLTAPLCVCLPEDCRTVKGLVAGLLRDHYGPIALRERVWDEREAWTVLRAVLCDALAVEPDAVTPDARLVEDLGAA